MDDPAALGLEPRPFPGPDLPGFPDVDHNLAVGGGQAGPRGLGSGPGAKVVEPGPVTGAPVAGARRVGLPFQTPGGEVACIKHPGGQGWWALQVQQQPDRGQGLGVPGQAGQGPGHPTSAQTPTHPSAGASG